MFRVIISLYKYFLGIAMVFILLLKEDYLVGKYLLTGAEENGMIPWQPKPEQGFFKRLGKAVWPWESKCKKSEYEGYRPWGITPSPMAKRPPTRPMERYLITDDERMFYIDSNGVSTQQTMVEDFADGTCLGFNREITLPDGYSLDVVQETTRDIKRPTPVNIKQNITWC